MEEKLEEVVEKTTQEVTNQVEETPQVDESKFESAGDDSVTKIDLSKPPKAKKDAVQESRTNASDATIGESKDSESSGKVVEEVRSSEKEGTVQDEETPVLEEITDDEVEDCLLYTSPSPRDS